MKTNDVIVREVVLKAKKLQQKSSTVASNEMPFVRLY